MEQPENKGFQLCVKCHGQGYVWFPPNLPWIETFTGDGIPFECDVCNGKKILNIETGLPPVQK